MNYIQKKCYSLLIEFDDFCCKNGVEYFLVWGTLLGAFRTGKFIEWDDDIDIGMDEENFQKFVRNKDKLPEYLRFENSFSDFNRKSGIPKLRNVREIDVVDDMGVRGVTIDIFVFRRYSLAQERIMKIRLVLRKIREERKKIKNNYIKYMYVVVTSPVAIFSKIYKMMTQRIVKSSPAYNVNQKVDICEWLNPHCWFSEKDIRPLSKIKFEGRLFSAPLNAKDFLEKRYGRDFMIPKRDGNRHFFNNKI